MFIHVGHSTNREFGLPNTYIVPVSQTGITKNYSRLIRIGMKVEKEVIQFPFIVIFFKHALITIITLQALFCNTNKPKLTSHKTCM